MNFWEQDELLSGGAGGGESQAVSDAFWESDTLLASIPKKMSQEPSPTSADLAARAQSVTLPPRPDWISEEDWQDTTSRYLAGENVMSPLPTEAEKAQHAMQASGMSAKEYAQYTSAQDSWLNNNLPPIVRDVVRGAADFGNWTAESAYTAAQKFPEYLSMAVIGNAGQKSNLYEGQQQVLQDELQISQLAAAMDQAEDSTLIKGIKAGARSLGEYGMAGGYRNAMAYTALVGPRRYYLENKANGMDDLDASRNALAKSWLVELPIMAVMGRVGGAGVEAVAGGSQGSIIGKYLAPKLSNLSKTTQEALAVVGNGLSEATEEDLTTLGQYYIDKLYGTEGTDEQLAEERAISRIAGMFGGSLGRVPKAISDIVTQAKEVIAEGEKLAAAAQDAQSYEGPVPRTDRRGFKDDTGKKYDTKTEREVFAETVAEKQAQEAAGATQTPAVEPPPVETPIPETPAEMAQASPDVVRTLVQSIVPDTVVVPQEDGSYRVDLPNGRFFAINFVDNVSEGINEKSIRSALQAYGLKDTKKNRARLLNDPNGSFTISSQEGEQFTGLGVVALANRLHKDIPRFRQTVRHETFHLARQLGLITDAEFEALRKKHAPNAETAYQAEEQIAKASEAWEGDRGLRAYLMDALDRLLSTLGVKKLRWQTAQNAVAKGDVFRRQPKNLAQARADNITSLTSLSTEDDSQLATDMMRLGGVDVMQNPTTEDYQRISADVRRDYPDMLPGEPKVRTTYDERGNKWIWRADKAVHSDIEPALAKRIGRPVSQNPTSLSANLEGEEQYPDRVRGLANISTDEAARQATSRVDTEMGTPQRQSVEEQYAIAEQRLAANPQGELDALLTRINQAEAVGDAAILPTVADTIIARRLAAQAVFDGNLDLHSKLTRAYRSSRTQIARNLRLRDPLANLNPTQRRHIELADVITEDSPRSRIERKRGNTKKADTLREQATASILEWLNKQGISMDTLSEIAKDPSETLKLKKKLQAKRATVADKFFEVWRNSVLSGPVTHIVNGASNATFGLWHNTAERTTAGLVNLLINDPTKPQLGELKYAANALVPGIQRGWANAIKAAFTGEAQLYHSLNRTGKEGKIEEHRVAIQGWPGEVVRTFGDRPLILVDEFFKGIYAEVAAASQAFRIANAEGLKGAQRHAKVRELLADPESAAWDGGIDDALTMTFQDEGGRVSQVLQSLPRSLRKNVPGVRYIFPFVRTPSNIFEQGMLRMPLVGMAVDYINGRAEGKSVKQIFSDPNMIARQALGFALVAAIAALDDDDEFPMITGSIPPSGKNSDPLYRPYSIRWPGTQTYVSYARIEPFATMLAGTVDAWNGVKRGEPIERSVVSMFTQTQDKTFLQGLADLTEASTAIKRDGTTAAAQEWASNFGASWVPNLIRQSRRNARGVVSQRRIWGTNDQERYNKLMERFAEQTELGKAPVARHDIFGRELTMEAPGYGPKIDLVYRLLSPLRIYNYDDVMEAELAILRWNMDHEQDMFTKGPMEPTRQLDGKKISLSDEQYAVLEKLAGYYVTQNTLRIRFSDPPTEAQMKSLDSAINKGRQRAYAQLRPKWRAGKTGEELLQSEPAGR